MRPPGATRSGENDEFGRGVIRALRQTMPGPAGQLGRVTVKLLLSNNGNLVEVQLIRSAGIPGLDQSVVFRRETGELSDPAHGLDFRRPHVSGDLHLQLSRHLQPGSGAGFDEPQRQLHGPERAPVVRRHPVALDGGVMFRRAVALVTLETIVGIGTRELDHDGVARDFGNDGSSRDGKAFRIAFDDRAARTGEPRRHLVAVDQDEPGLARKLSHRVRHGP